MQQSFSRTKQREKHNKITQVLSSLLLRSAKHSAVSWLCWQQMEFPRFENQNILDFFFTKAAWSIGWIGTMVHVLMWTSREVSGSAIWQWIQVTNSKSIICRFLLHSWWLVNSHPTLGHANFFCVAELMGATKNTVLGLCLTFWKFCQLFLLERLYIEKF